MAAEKIVAYLLALILCIAAVQAGSIHKRSFFSNEIEGKARPSTSDATNRLILRLIDAAIEDARERGAGEEELSDMMRKRGGIGKCFFHALNCW